MKPAVPERSAMKKVAVFGHVGRGNLGDEATFAAVIHDVRLRHPNAEICAFTMNPSDTRERHKLPAFPIRRLDKPVHSVENQPQGDGGKSQSQGITSRLRQSLKAVPLMGTALRGLRDGAYSVLAAIKEVPFALESIKHLKGTDLLIVAGGGQLTDYFGGTWGYPFTVLKWSIMARARGAKVAFLSVGAGPIKSLLSKFFIRWSLSVATYRSFRDESSRKLIESLGVTGENRVSPDLVHGLQSPETISASRRAVCIVGINPLPFHDPRYWTEDSPHVYQRHVQTLASFAVWLINAGCKVLLFPTQVKADPPVIEDVAALVRISLPIPCGDSLICPAVSSFDDLLSALAQTDLVVASRFHGIIISFLMGRPVIALSYNQKTDDLMADMDLGEFVADIGRCDVPWLILRFERLRAEAEDVRRRIESRRSDYRAALDKQYALVLGKTADPESCLAPLTA